jgi:hypothetical protein
MKEARYFYVPDAALGSELPEEEAQHACVCCASRVATSCS